MLTNDELNRIEAAYPQTEDVQPHSASWRIAQLVGELRAERTRTETLRAALADLVQSVEAQPAANKALRYGGLPQARAALTASVEETP